MALIRWRDRDLEPVGTFDWLQQQINDLFEIPRFPEMQGLFDRTISPAVDVVEHPDHFRVECDLPGLDMKDIDLSIGAGVLTIKGEKKEEKPGDKAKVYRKETWEGSFQRTVSLPATVDADKVEATYRDGVLRVSIARRESALPRRVTVQ